MDASTQKQTSAAIGMAALVLALVVSVPSGIVGFATGYGASRSGSGSVHTVVHTTQQPAPQAPAWSFSNNDPDWLEDPDAMASLPERIAGRVAYAGRFKFLSVGTDKTVVAQVEVEGHGVREHEPRVVELVECEELLDHPVRVPARPRVDRGLRVGGIPGGGEDPDGAGAVQEVVAIQAVVQLVHRDPEGGAGGLERVLEGGTFECVLGGIHGPRVCSTETGLGQPTSRDPCARPMIFL